MKRTWPLFVAEFLLAERRLVRGTNPKLVLHVMAHEFLGLISRDYARSVLRSA